MHRTITLTILMVVLFSGELRAQDSVPQLPREVRNPELIAGAAKSPIDLDTALQLTLTRNPNLIAVRQNRPVSAAAWAVARRLPMSLNPTVAVDLRPWTFDGDTGDSLDTVVSASVMQPIQLSHQNARRAAIGRAAYRQTDWEIVQAELAALVQTYRLYETAVYRRAKLDVARQLAAFNTRLVASIRRQLQAAQVSPADLALAEVQNQSTVQQLQAAEQQYIAALTELRNQLAIPEYAASLTPVGTLQLAAGPDSSAKTELVRTALQRHPAIQTAEARLAAARAALRLARANRVPVPSVGPVYESDESGTTFYGMAISSAIPVLNSGLPLVRQREAECRREAVRLDQLRLQIAAQVEAALQQWVRTRAIVDRMAKSTSIIATENEKMQRLFKAGQTDLLRLLNVRQPLIQAQNAQLDITWQATLAYADLLSAIGVSDLLLSQANETAN